MVPFDPAAVTDGHAYLFEGGSPDDSSPLAHNLPVVGAPQTVQGLNGDALQFDGAADGLNVPDSASINDGAGPYGTRTVIAVFRCDDVDKPGKQTVFEEGGTTRGSNIYVSEGLLYVSAWNRAEYNWNGEWPSMPIESGEWYVAAMVIRDGGEAVEPDKFEMWVNGELIAQLPGGHLHNHGDDGAIGYTQVNTVFHDGNASPSLGHYFGGAIDEVWILNEALTTAQLAALGPNPTLAKNPVPAHESIDALRDGTLSWEPGVFAQAHDVYFGTVLTDVNEASRDNDMGVLASQGQADAAYDPGRLEFGQTYFWRVDEVNGAPDRTIFKGEVWSFEAEPFSVAVANITATASSSHAVDMGPERTIDGSGLDALGQHSSNPTAMWLSGMGDPTPSIQYEFDKAYKLHQLLVWNSNQAVESFVGLSAKDVVIETSTDGETWVLLEGTPPFGQGTGQANYVANTTVDFAGTVAKFVKLTITTGYGMIPQYGLSEVRFLSIPTNAREPKPVDGATTGSIDVVLNWRAGREAASHEVYLGTDPNALALAATTQENSYQATGLDYATTYHWQIVEVNDAEDPSSHAGDVVSFSTPAFGTVDNFDQYDDDCNRVFFAWVDGLGHNGGEDVENCNVPPSNGNGGGSIVGNDVSPFAERTIVRSVQSMPLEYDNSFGASEATLKLASQDWTTGGVQTLSLYFRGDPANTGQLYVKINNSKVTYDGLPDALQRTQWLPWNIDLSTVGGNLQSVTSLSIGVDGATASGMLYVDDIRLYPLAPESITPVDPDPANLVSYYAFDGDARDSVGGLHGTLVGNASFAPGQQGQAISLNTLTVTDYVDIVGYQGLLGAPAITVTAWVKTTSDATGAIIGWGPNVAGQRFGFRIDVGRIRHEHHGGNIQGDTVMNDGNWHHVAITVDPNATVSYPEAKLWLDGLDDTRRTTDPDPYAIVADLDVSIGRRPAGDDRYYIGEIDELYIYNRVLSAAEIAGMAGITQPFDKPFD